MVNISKLEINERQVDEFEEKIHRFAEQMPLMDTNDFKALVKSIEEVGQLEPIITYRGLVLDGRNRVNALKQLNIKTIKVQALPHRTESKDLMLIVNAKEARRKQTKLQLAISGYNMWLSTGEKQEDVAARLGTSDKSIRKIRELVDTLGLSLQTLKELHAGNGFIINTLNGESTTSLNRIYEIMKLRAKNNTASIVESNGSTIMMAEDPSENKIIESVLNMTSLLSDLGRMRLINKIHELKE